MRVVLFKIVLSHLSHVENTYGDVIRFVPLLKIILAYMEYFMVQYELSVLFL